MRGFGEEIQLDGTKEHQSGNEMELDQSSLEKDRVKDGGAKYNSILERNIFYI